MLESVPGSTCLTEKVSTEYYTMHKTGKRDRERRQQGMLQCWEGLSKIGVLTDRVGGARGGK